MPLCLRRTIAVLSLLALVVPALPALAQHPRVEAIAPGVQFERLSLAEASAKAKREFKLLVEYVYLPGSPEHEVAKKKMLANPTLALFLKWHAVTIASPTGTKLVPVELRVYKDGKLYGRIGCISDPLSLSIEGVHKLLPEVQTGGTTLREPHRPTPGAAGALFTVDFALDKIRAADPVWYELHHRKNPPPEPPPLSPPFYLADDGLADIIEDPPEDDSTINVLDRLESARRAVRVGNLHYATGLYTWLWEEGAKRNPAFAPAARSFLVAEMADLAARRDGARERFAKIRDSRSNRLMWATFDDYHEWCALNAACGEEDLIIEWFDFFINDDQEATMMPRAHRAAFELLLARERFADAFELPRATDPVSRVARLAGARRRRCPVTSTPEDWQRFLTFADQLFFNEACRLHAACLAAGLDTQADHIAAILLKHKDTPEARCALVTTALVAGQPRDAHFKLLDQAELAGADVADLRARLGAALEAPAAATSASAPEPPAPSPGSSLR